MLPGQLALGLADLGGAYWVDQLALIAATSQLS
jgi:hypothetical protein